MSPPNTVNELNVASPTCALDPTATAAVPTITFGAYSTDSAVRLNCPNIESVIAYRSCIVDQCTTSEPTMTTPDSPTSASTPATAARTASGSHLGSGDASQRAAADARTDADRRADRVHGQHAAERPQRVRRLQFGQHRRRVVDDRQRRSPRSASGPPSADATTQRVTNHDACV